MLEVLIVHRFVLNLASLVHGLHRPEHTATTGNRFEFLKHGFLYEVGQFVHDVSALHRVLRLGPAALLVDDQLNRQGAAHRFFGGGGDGLVVGVGVEGVGVVLNRQKGLQGRSDVVEVDLLGVKAASTRLNVVLEFLTALVGPVHVAHGDRPNAACDAADDRVFRIEPVGEEEGKVRCELVDVHASAAVVLHVGEPVGECQRELRDGVGARLSDVVARNGHGVVVANAVVDVVLLHVAHEFERKGRGEDAGVLRLVFLENVGLDRPSDRLQGSCLDFSVGGSVHHFVASSSHGGQTKSVVAFGEFASVGRVKQLHRLALLDQVGFHLLVDGSVEEEGENDGRWPVDGHRDRGVGVAQIKAGVEPLGVVGRGDGNTGIADLAPNVRAASGVPSVERDRVKGRGKTNVVLALAQVVEAAVGALGLAFTCKHAGR